MTLDPDAPAGADLAATLLQRCSFPPATEGRVGLAVSGGADSLALMVLAARAGLEAWVIHVDHGLRPDSHLDSEVVAKAAASFHFDFECVAVTVEQGPNLEARARRARYEALPAGVLTGHTMDDQAETVVLNLLRGAALDGLSGMRVGPAARVRRPLLGIRRFETVALCEWAGLCPVIDSTNTDPRFRRNRVRHELLPLMSGIASRDVVPVLARQAELLAGDGALLDGMAAGVDPTDAKQLRAAPPPVARRAVRSWLRHIAGGELHPPSSAEIARVLAVANGTATACEVAGGYRIQRTQGKLRVVAPK
jgi:tRNA(Ile)-lysidine synthase